MTDQIPDWLAVPLIAVLGVVALYQCYILPNYEKDQNNGKES